VFQYDPRGMRSKVFKPNSNVQASTYYEDGRLKTQTERLGLNGLGWEQLCLRAGSAWGCRLCR
jgi:hypothetical protein